MSNPGRPARSRPESEPATADRERMRMPYAQSVRYTHHVRTSITLIPDDRPCRAAAARFEDPVGGRRTVSAVEWADPGTHRRGRGRTGRFRRAGRPVDGAAGRAVGLRHDVAVPACHQQGRVGDVHAGSRARSPAQKTRQRGLDWRPNRLVSRAMGCLPPPPLGAASLVGRTARGSRPTGVAECRTGGPGRYRAGRARQAGRRHGGAALRARGGGPCDRCRTRSPDRTTPGCYDGCSMPTVSPRWRPRSRLERSTTPTTTSSPNSDPG